MSYSSRYELYMIEASLLIRCFSFRKTSQLNSVTQNVDKALLGKRTVCFLDWHYGHNLTLGVLQPLLCCILSRAFG